MASKLNKRRAAPPANVIAKGQAALAAFRAEKAAAKAKGDKYYQQWLAEQEVKKAQKKTTPMQAIKAFCNECVGGIREDIRNCTSQKCPLWIYRPYQTKDDD